MGADNFFTPAKGASAKEAFDTAVRDAQWDHGHGGYTGTIAEKSGFVLYPLHAGITASMLADALATFAWIDEDRKNDSEYAKRTVESFDKVVAAYGKAQLERMVDVYDDKWGPALCVKHDAKTWVFMGYASS